MSELSDRLRALRGETTQAEMARQLEMPRQQWINYEKGKNAPGADIIAKICRAHACSADWLLGLSDKPTSIAITNGRNSPIVSGNHNSVTLGESALCSRCPYKKKLKGLEKAFKTAFE